MNTTDLDDTHLCIKCKGTILGLAKYIKHRKHNCLSLEKATIIPSTTTTNRCSTLTSTTSAPVIGHDNLEHTFDTFHFVEPETPTSFLRKPNEIHSEKSSKTMAEAYDLPYELEADVFFSSLQLQSVSTGGKTVPGGRSDIGRSKDEDWHTPRGDPLLKAIREHDDTVFKALKFEHDSPEPSEDDEEVEELNEFEEDVEEDYERRHSPPAIPSTHTGGKWKPEHRPQLGHLHIERLSPNWEEPSDETYSHPPAEYTKGKWIPGSKQLEYRENIDLTKVEQFDDSYWCNICCRRLKSRTNYEAHMQSTYHLKKADTECQLEQATFGAELTLSKHFSLDLLQTIPNRDHAKGQRRSNLLRCDLCLHTLPRHLIGKHLISHYHYRRLRQQSQSSRQTSLHIILNHMVSIVKQSPFQCVPCRFYANTEAAFLNHWESVTHRKLTSGLGGTFWCDYCQFECDSNEAMWEHFLQSTHKEVISSLNRSVPVYIAQRRHIPCTYCNMRFLYNIQLRHHFSSEHPGHPPTGTAADDYQCFFRCQICQSSHRSRVALQRHEKHKHQFMRYYCAICRLEFETPIEARRHRGLLQHRMKTKPNKSVSKPDQDVEQMLRKILEDQSPNPSTENRPSIPNRCTNCLENFESHQLLAQHWAEVHSFGNHGCLSCGCNFQSAQALGKHTRNCQPLPSTSNTHSLNKSDSWPCDKCSFSSQYKSDFIYHQLFHTKGKISNKNELLQCPLCTKQFRKHSLRAHLRNHTGEKIFQCAECLQKFARRHNLKNHIISMHTPTKKKQNDRNKRAKNATEYKCKTCKKTYRKKYSLKLHEMSHTNKSVHNFHCHFKDCTYSGLTQENLKIHLVSHSQESHKCNNENCNYVGKSQLHLKRHLKSCAIERIHLFSCNQCDFKARIKGHLTRHLLRHSGAKPHKCPYCDFHCSTIDNLRKHIIKTEKHPGKYIYECNKCLNEQSPHPLFKSNSLKEYQKHLIMHLNK